MRQYSFGRNRFKQTIGRFLVGCSTRFRKLSAKVYLSLVKALKYFSEIGDRWVEEGSSTTIRLVKIEINSPRTTVFKFNVDGVEMYLFHHYDKTPETVERFAAYKRGELEIDGKLEDLIFIKENKDNWLK